MQKQCEYRDLHGIGRREVVQRLGESSFLRSVMELGTAGSHERMTTGQAGNSSRLLLQGIGETQHALSSIRQFPSLTGSGGRVQTHDVPKLFVVVATTSSPAAGSSRRRPSRRSPTARPIMLSKPANAGN